MKVFTEFHSDLTFGKGKMNFDSSSQFDYF